MNGIERAAVWFAGAVLVGSSFVASHDLRAIRRSVTRPQPAPEVSYVPIPVGAPTCWTHTTTYPGDGRSITTERPC